MTVEAGRYLITEAGREFSKKANYDQLCQELAYYMYPEKADFTDEIYIGEEFTDHITDPTPMRDCRDLGDQIGTMLRSGEWFNVAVNEELMGINSVRRKLDEMTAITRGLLYEGIGFKRAVSEVDKDFAAFGCGAFSVTLSRDLTRFVYKTWHLRDMAWSTDHDGVIERQYRKWEARASDIYGMFNGVRGATVPKSVMDNMKNGKAEALHKVYHIVRPNMGIETDYRPQRSIPANVPYIGTYVSSEGEIILEQPEWELPYVIPRWKTVRTWGDYPFSPAALTALPHSRMLQRIMLSYIESGEKAVDPPLIATTDAIQSPIDLRSGAVTWVDSEYDERLGAGVRPLDLGKNVPLNERMLEMFHEDHKHSWYLSKLNLPDTRERTAYEVEQLMNEFIRTASPIFDPLEEEYNTGTLETVVNKALRLGVYGPPESFPEEMQGADIRYTYSNPLREAQERQKVQKYQQAVEVVGIGAQLDPQVALNFDNHTAARQALQGVGVPAEWITDEADVAEAIEQTAQQQQQMQGMEELQQGAAAVNDAAVAAQNVEAAVG